MKVNPYIYPILDDKCYTGYIEIICKHFNISFEMVKSRNKKRKVIDCKYFIIYFLKQHKFTQERIGEIVNCKHSNVSIALAKMEYAITAYHKQNYEQLIKLI